MPVKARAFFGKREVQVSLETSSLAEARHRMAPHLRDFDRTLAKALSRPDPTVNAANDDRPVTTVMIDMAAREWLATHLEREAARDFNRSAPDARSAMREQEAHSQLLVESLMRGQPQLETHWIASAIIERQGWKLRETDSLYAYLLNRIVRGEQELGRRIKDEIDFLPHSERDATFSHEAYLLDEKRKDALQPASKVSISGLLTAYVAEAECKPATVKAWKGCTQHLIAFLGHDDAARVQPQDIVRWKENLAAPNAQGEVRSSRTIKDKYLAAAKTIFKWAAENHKIASNPTLGISIRVRKRARVREDGLSDDEACIILTASLSYADASPQTLQARARRWIPWLCAYSGARVGEIAQLRGEDFLIKDGVACFRITPEAGSEKNDRARTVPVHPHLLAQGILTALATAKGPIFFDPSNHRGGSEGNPQSKKVAERLGRWVRDIGVTDENVQPNHGWRHRFKTEARQAGMDAAISDAIQGHAHRTEGEAYGHYPPKAMKREMEKLRQFVFDAAVRRVTIPEA